MASWRSPFDDSHAEASRGDSRDPLPRSHGSSTDPRFDHAWAFQRPANQHDFHHHAGPTPATSLSPDPGVSFHPVIDVSRSASSSSNANAGQFVHSQCDQGLFNTEYLRSNKASGHKNLRCFPHCCGGHNPKSFCGSGLVVECALPDAQVAIGRFEELVKSPHGATTNSSDPASTPTATKSPSARHAAEFTNQLHHDLDAAPSPDTSSLDASASDRPILPGHTYSRRELFRELKSSENPFGRWFRGTPVAASASAGAARPRFHLNGNRASWHYGWQSSRLNCKNLHVFRVYFFAGDDDRDALTCVTSVGSPPFRISSSRKARKTFRSSPSMQSLADSVSGDDQLSLPQSSPRHPGAGHDDDRLSVDSFDGGAATSSGTLPTLRSRSSFDLGLGFGAFAPATSSGGGDVLPSLSSRLSRASTLTATIEQPFVRHYGAEPDRKRLTRSASLQTDYYSTHTHGLATREPRSRTFPVDETTHAHATHATTTPVRSSRSGMMSMDSLLNSAPPPFPAFPTEPAFRPSLATVSVPPLTLSHFHQHHHRPSAIVTTPVADMMQLQLSTPRGLPRSVSASSAVPASEFMALRPEPSPTTPSAHHARRKRTRSADASTRTAGDNQLPSWHDGPLLAEIAPDGDWDLVAQAHALGAVFAIASRLRPVASGGDASAYEIVWKLPTTGHAATARIARETQPALARLCDVLLAVAAQLIHRSSFLVSVRAKMHELTRGSRDHASSAAAPPHDEGRCKHLVTLYEDMLAFVLPRVEEQIAAVLQQNQYDGSHDAPSPLVALLRLAEHEIARERWWRDVAIFDDDDDEYPFMDFFKGYYEAVRAASAFALSPVPLPLPSLHHSATLSGEWRLLQASLDELDLATQPRAAALGWAPMPWLPQQLALYESQTYRLVETAARLTLTLGNSLVASASPFHIELDTHAPVARVPVDHFPFAPTRRHLLVAHRAWRESAGTNPTSTTLVVRAMQWPTEAESRLSPDGRRELLRTRVAMQFALVAPSRLRVRFVVEGSVTADAKLCAMAFAPPNDADMAEYIDAPAAWEPLAQSTLSYERA